MTASAWELINRTPGRFGLAAGPGAEQAAMALARQAGGAVTHVGSLLTVEHPDGIRSPERLLRGHRVLVDLDVLFWPDVLVDPLRLLRTLARYTPLVAHWPGEISGGRATYSEPGRRDHYDQPVPAEAIVLRARSTTFPDELPYVVERT